MSSNVLKRGGGFAEEQRVGELLTGAEDVAQLLGDGEGDEKVGNGQKAGALGVAPGRGLRLATAWTGAVVAGVEDATKLSTRLAGVELAAEGGGAAAQDGRDRRPVGRQYGFTMGREIGRPMALEDRRQLDHGKVRQATGDWTRASNWASASRALASLGAVRWR